MAFRTKKISQMDPKGSNLASTDLLEISQLVSGSYVTKSITGAQIAASAPAAAWGTITGTLSAQTDLNTALSGKVPTTRTLTINGTTQDLSADRTFTISTGITIGTTAITSGTVGRVLFEGTGNVVQESAGLTYNDTTKAFTLSGNLNSGITYTSENTSTGVTANAGFAVKNSLGVIGGLTAFSSLHGVVLLRSNVVLSSGPSASNVILATAFDVASGGTGSIQLATGGYSGNPTKMTVFGSTGNVLIQNGGTHTDAGFKLDVNGTARFTGNTQIGWLEFRTSGSASNTGQGITSTGTDTTFQLQGSGSSSAIDMFQFRNWAGSAATAQPVNVDKSVIRIYGGFTSGNASNLSGNTLSITPTYNLTGNATIVRGVYYNPTLTSLTNGTHFAFHSTSGRIRFENLPTSPAGLSSGDVWNNLGILTIV